MPVGDSAPSKILYLKLICIAESFLHYPSKAFNFIFIPLNLGYFYDESEVCVEHAQQGKCTNSALHQYANFCKCSCGLCSKYRL